MSLSPVIIGEVQQKIKEETKKNIKKAKRRKKDEEEGKIVQENENSNYNKKVVKLSRSIYTQCLQSR